MDSFPFDGDSGKLELVKAEIWNGTWIGAATSTMDAHANEASPFKRYEKLILQTNLGVVDANGDALVRYAYGQTTRVSAFDASPQGSAGKSIIGTSENLTPRNYSWLCGNRMRPRRFGTHAEIIPARATVAWQGPDSPLRISLKGIAGARTGSEFLEDLADRIGEAQENTRKEGDV